MTTTIHELIRAARQFDGTMAGAESAEATVSAITTAPHIIAACAGWLARRMAGHLNTVGTTDWDHRDDDEADVTIEQAMLGVHEGREHQRPNMGADADHAMVALVELARIRDDAERLAFAEVWRGNPAKALAVAFVGIQLVALLAAWTGDAQSALDGLAVEVMALEVGL